MSHRKRKLEVGEENVAQSGLKKVRRVEEGHLKKFLSLAASEDTLIAGLTYLLTTTQQDGLDLLKMYLESCSDCEHLLTPLTWERERRNQDVVLLCFQCLEQVLLFTASPDDESSSTQTSYSSLGTDLIHTILNNHMRCIYSSLVTTVPMRLVASCLRLLTAMVAQGSNAAREVQRVFNFGYKPLEVFPSRTHILQGSSESVRMCFLKFAMSFLVVGDHSTVADILQLKGFLSSFFKLLPKDTTETIQLFLSTLLQQVVLDPKVSKKAKSIFFNQYILKQVTQLLTQSTKSEEEQEGWTGVRMLVFELLSTLCTDFQLGVCYKNREPPEGLERTNNPVILHLLLSFTGSLDDPLIQELIIKTLSTCPDLMVSYVKSLNFSFEPQPNSKWVSGMDFWTRLYKALPKLPDVIVQGSSDQPCSSRADIAVRLTVPLPSARHAFSLGLQHTLPLVKYQTLLLLEAVLSRAQAVVEAWGPVHRSLTTLDSFLVRYCDSVLKSLPDFRTLISLRQQLQAGFDKKKIKTSLDDLLPAHRIKNTELLESPSHLLLLTLKVMHGYQRLSPLIFMQADFNVAKLLPPLDSDDHSSPEATVTTLQILNDATIAGQNWWKPTSCDVLSVILGLSVSENEDVAREAHLLTLELIAHSSIVGGDQLEMLLSCMKSYYAAPDCRQTLVEFVSSVLLSAIKDTPSFPVAICGDDGGHEMELGELSLEDVLGRPLVIPDCTTVSKDTVNEECGKSFPLATLVLEALVNSEADAVIEFVGEVMAKILLAQPSDEKFEQFSALVIHQLECEELKNKYLTSEWKDTYLDVLKYFNYWSVSTKASTILVESKIKRKSLSLLLKKYGSKPTAHSRTEQDPLVTKWLLAPPSSWDMSDLALNELLDLTISHSCDELDSVAYTYLRKHIAVCSGWTAQRTVHNTHKDSQSYLAKSMVALTEKLTSCEAAEYKECATPWWYQAEVENTLSVSGGVSRLSNDPALQGQIKAIVANLKRNFSASKRALKLFESPLFHFFVEEEEDVNHHDSVCLHEQMINRLLNYVLTSVTPVRGDIAKLLIESSEVARDLLESNHLHSMCRGVQSESEEESVGMLQIVSKFLEEILAESAHTDDAVTSDNHKKSIKFLCKNIWSLCLMHVAVENLKSLQVASSQVIKHLCAASVKGFKKFKKVANQWLLTGKLTRVQFVLCCEVAYAQSEGQFSSAVVRQGIVMLSQLFKETAVTSEENTAVKLMIGILERVIEPLGFDANQWNEFVHQALKQRFAVDGVLKLLSRLIVVVYTNDHSDSDVDTTLPIPLSTVYEMIWSHSEFLCTISSSETAFKGSLVELMVHIVELMPSVCDSTHVSVLLSSYLATRNSSDRGILYLLHLYEMNGATVGHHRPFLWGPAAAEQYRLKRETDNWLLWKQPGSRDVIDNFDKKLLKLSTEHFPLDSLLKPRNPFLESPLDTARTDIYDPCFLLPLMSHMLDTSCVVDCRQFVDHGCLSYLLTSLCSHHDDVRNAAGHALSRYLMQLEGSKFKEKAEIYFLLKVLRNSIDEGGVVLSSLYGAFLAESAVLLLHPDNQLYSVVSHFLAYKPALAIADIPLQNILLHSSSIEHLHERAWMLKVLANGLRREEDIQLYTRKEIFTQVMALFGAGLLDRRCMINCFELMEKASNIHTSKATSVLNNTIAVLF